VSASKKPANPKVEFVASNSISVEEIAVLATQGEDVSPFFTSDFRVFGPGDGAPTAKATPNSRRA
jgi:hypothetical protein